MHDGVQLTIGMTIVAGAYAAAIYFWNRDETRWSQEVRPDSDRASVTVAASPSGPEVVNSTDPSSGRFVRIPDSINRPGGSEMTYSFYATLSAPPAQPGAGGGPALVDGVVMRGDLPPGVYSGGAPNRLPEMMGGGEGGKNGVGLTACPLIYFETWADGSVKLRTTFNIIDYNHPPPVELAPPPSPQPQPQSQLAVAGKAEPLVGVDLGPVGGAMHFAVCIRDTNPGMDPGMHDKVRVDFYVNGDRARRVYVDRCEDVTQMSVPEVCRAQLATNRGNVYVLPSLWMPTGKIVNLRGLRYHNWFLSEADVRNEIRETLPGTGLDRLERWSKAASPA